MSTDLLHQKVISLSSYPLFHDQLETLRKFEEGLRNLDDWGLARINPLAFAEHYGLPSGVCVDLFIAGAKIGLFDLRWNLLCPGCGGVEYSVESMDQIAGDKFHCTICSIDVTTELDNQIEAAFSINRGIIPIDVSPFKSFDCYRRHFFSSNYERSKELNDYSHRHFVSFTPLDPDGQKIIEFTADRSSLYRLLSMVSHSELHLRIDDKETEAAQTLIVDIAENGFMVHNLQAHPGQISLAINNRTKKPNAAALLKTDFSLLHSILKSHPNIRRRFLTAKDLLNNQTFRELFRVQNLSRDLSLNVQNLSIIFTDLKDSTMMYDRAGDFTAYKLVRRHFEILIAIIRKNSGAIVKTMGDAIMATFSTPAHAVRASVDMLRQAAAMPPESGYRIGLKVGAHEGSALAVVADERLDYFGQSVNIACRVQNLAAPGELWLTESMLQSPGIENLCRTQGISPVQHSAMLKGIEQPMSVYQCRVV